MNKRYSLFVIICILLFSCSEENKKDSSNSESSVISKSLNSVKSGMVSVKDYVVEPESEKAKRREDYMNLMLKTYPEYKNIQSFFHGKSANILESGGRFYRIVAVTITDDGSVIHKGNENPKEVQYFYDADDNYYIYTFDISNNSHINCTNIRRIKKGNFSQPMHDLIFENGKLIREQFILDVSKDFYDKNDTQFFKISSKVEGSKVENLFNLGQVQDF